MTVTGVWVTRLERQSVTQLWRVNSEIAELQKN